MKWKEPEVGVRRAGKQVGWVKKTGWGRKWGWENRKWGGE